MGRYKCAYNCEIPSDSDVKYFKFPLYHHRKLKKWLSNMNMKDWTPSRFSVLCSNHFEEQHIDRMGKNVKLKDDAVPTIFLPLDETPKTTASTNQRNKRPKQAAAKSSQTSSVPASTPAVSHDNVPTAPASQPDDEPVGHKIQKKPEKWRIIVDQGLMKIDSFPHFFHGDYCLPQDIQWAPDDTDRKDPENVIEVKEPWQWLGLDVRAKHVVEMINHFGFPLRILSRLPQDIVHKINTELKDQLQVSVALVVPHQQTGSADLTTQQLIDRMVNDLIEEHADDWDVYLPARVFSLCFREHSQTKERPFSVLCCSGFERVQSPRSLSYDDVQIQESALVVCHRSSEAAS